MAGKYSFGLQVDGVKASPLEADGGYGKTLVSNGEVLENTIELNAVTNTDTEFKAQGATSASVIITEKGIKEGRFALMTFDPEVMADWTGGTTSGAGADMLYHEPEGVVTVEKTLLFVDTQGNGWLIARAKINASLVGRFRNGELNTIEVTFKQMQPTKAGVKSFTYGKLSAVMALVAA